MMAEEDAMTYYRANLAHSQLVRVRAKPTGQFTAEVVGLPELQATAPTRDEAVREVASRLQQWLNTGELAAVEVKSPNPLMLWFGNADPNDPVEQEFLAELARMKQEDLEQTLREYDQECSNSSSTPTT
jgi:hypothetical protein